MELLLELLEIVEDMEKCSLNEFNMLLKKYNDDSTNLEVCKKESELYTYTYIALLIRRMIYREERKNKGE